jgi:hypothetical protein
MKELQDLDDVIDIQQSNGNWNCNSYMWGLANGLILARSILDGKEPLLMEKPLYFLDDKPNG